MENQNQQGVSPESQNIAPNSVTPPPNQGKSLKWYIVGVVALLVIGLGVYFLAGSGLFKGQIKFKDVEQKEIEEEEQAAVIADLEECISGIPANVEGDATAGGFAGNGFYELGINDKENCKDVQIASADENVAKIIYSKIELAEEDLSEDKSGLTWIFYTKNNMDPSDDTNNESWDFGDGTKNEKTQYGADMSHSYKDPGDYTVTVTSKVNGTKKTITATKKIKVKEFKAVANCVQATDNDGTATPFTVSCSSEGSSKPRAGQTMNYSWTFGDTGDGAGNNNEIAANSEYKYLGTDKTGMHTIKLTVTDTETPQHEATARTDIEFDSEGNVVEPAGDEDQELPVTAEIACKQIDEPLAINCSPNLTNDKNINIADLVWNYGDSINNETVNYAGTNSSNTTYHTYPAAGTYTVTLKIKVEGYLEKQFTKEVTVVDNPGAEPIADISAQCNPAPTPENPLGIHCSATSPVDTDSVDYSYSWDFKDTNEASTGPEIDRTLPDNSDRTIALTVTDNSVPPKTGTKDILFQYPNPIAVANCEEASDDGNVGGGGFTVSCRGNGSSGGTGDLSYAWILSDGTNHTGMGIENMACGIVADPDNMICDITLTVTDAVGKTGKASASIEFENDNSLLTNTFGSLFADVFKLITPDVDNNTAPLIEDENRIVTVSHGDGIAVITGDVPNTAAENIVKFRFKTDLGDGKGSQLAQWELNVNVNGPEGDGGDDGAGPKVKASCEELQANNTGVELYIVRCTSTVTPDAGDDVDFDWYFGDDTDYQAGRTVDHTYKGPGTYNVTFTMFEKAEGNKELAKDTIEVKVVGKPVVVEPKPAPVAVNPQDTKGNDGGGAFAYPPKKKKIPRFEEPVVDDSEETEDVAENVSVTVDGIVELDKFDCLEENKAPSIFADTDDNESTLVAGAADENSRFKAVTEAEKAALLASISFDKRAIIQGFSENGKTMFNGNSPTNRAEILKTLMVASCTPFDLTTEEGFEDNPRNAWFHPYIASAKVLGIISGYADGAYRPELTVSRIEAIKISMKILGSKADLEIEDSCEEQPFADVPEDHWGNAVAREAFCAGIATGELKGNSRYLNPDETLTRSEMATLIYNFYAAVLENSEA